MKCMRCIKACYSKHHRRYRVGHNWHKSPIEQLALLVVFWNILLHFPSHSRFRLHRFFSCAVGRLCTLLHRKWNGKLFNNDTTHKMKKGGKSVLLFCVMAHTHSHTYIHTICGQHKVASFVFTIETNKKNLKKKKKRTHSSFISFAHRTNWNWQGRRKIV